MWTLNLAVDTVQRNRLSCNKRTKMAKTVLQLSVSCSKVNTRASSSFLAQTHPGWGLHLRGTPSKTGRRPSKPGWHHPSRSSHSSFFLDSLLSLLESLMLCTMVCTFCSTTSPDFPNLLSFFSHFLLDIVLCHEYLDSLGLKQLAA